MPVVKKVQILWHRLNISQYNYLNIFTKTNTRGSIPAILHCPPPLHSKYSRRLHVLVLAICSMTQLLFNDSCSCHWTGLCSTKKLFFGSPFHIFARLDQPCFSFILGGRGSLSLSMSLSACLWEMTLHHHDRLCRVRHSIWHTMDVPPQKHQDCYRELKTWFQTSCADLQSGWVFYSVSQCVIECVYLRRFMEQLGYAQKSRIWG